MTTILDRPKATVIQRANATPFGLGSGVWTRNVSGYGRESGLQQMDEYLNVKAVWINTD